jgi:hypothetical protein
LRASSSIVLSWRDVAIPTTSEAVGTRPAKLRLADAVLAGDGGTGDADRPMHRNRILPELAIAFCLNWRRASRSSVETSRCVVRSRVSGAHAPAMNA